MNAVELPVWAYVYGSPSGQGKFRSVPEDFIVTEHLAFEPSGSGEHVFLSIEKTGENTDYVARQLAKFAGVRQRDVSYAGLKDRHAVTTQWFSVWLPRGAEPNWQEFETDNIKVLRTVRHARKLKRGVLSGNSFKLIIRDWQGDVIKLNQQLEAIKADGIANYYGEQRFGHAGHNINKALAMFEGAKVGREQRSIYLSAARSYLFNQILSQRVLMQTWNTAMAGDYYAFDCSHSYFKEQPTEDITRRLAAKEIHATGILWGKGNAELSPVEQAVIIAHQALADGLVASGLEQDRRALRINVTELGWQFIDDTTTLSLSFTLPAGSYATAVLREIIGVSA